MREEFAFGSGYVPDPDAPWPVADLHNAREAAWAKPRPVSEVVARLDAGHDNAVRLWESLDADELADDRYRDYLAGKCEEFDAHCEELVELLAA